MKESNLPISLCVRRVGWYVRRNVYACIPGYMHTHMHAYIHAYVHPCIHKCMHAPEKRVLRGDDDPPYTPDMEIN